MFVATWRPYEIGEIIHGVYDLKKNGSKFHEQPMVILRLATEEEFMKQYFELSGDTNPKTGFKYFYEVQTD